MKRIKTFVFLDADKCVYRCGSGYSVPPGGIEVSGNPQDYVGTQLVETIVEVPPEAIPPEMVNPDNPNGVVVEMVEAFLPRPMSPGVVESADSYHVLDCPEGTTIVVYDTIGHEVLANLVVDADGSGQEIEFSDAGVYFVSVTAPKPHLPNETVLNVEEPGS
ncbi:hypothetical protein [Roseovarius sp. MMSF_3350]|uniref:hypothetical protein n=1 Tax=Roseovarius sp. MMSF_3350 TaxID=3046706 RepID=UPI00273FF979|nr:hypothetical protein [Roseovarius sp. MMSF_3350]